MEAPLRGMNPANYATAEEGKREKIQVVVKVRPIMLIERGQAARYTNKTVVLVEGNELFLKDPYEGMDSKIERRRGEHKYEFNFCFGERSNNLDVFNSVMIPLLDAVLEGYNACCFCYGMTGAGKTYTMMGHLLPSVPRDVKGIYTYTGEYIFSKINENKGNKRYRLKVSYLEIYNEKIRDLLEEDDEEMDEDEYEQKDQIQQDNKTPSNSNQIPNENKQIQSYSELISLSDTSHSSSQTSSSSSLSTISEVTQSQLEHSQNSLSLSLTSKQSSPQQQQLPSIYSNQNSLQSLIPIQIQNSRKDLKNNEMNQNQSVPSRLPPIGQIQINQQENKMKQNKKRKRKSKDFFSDDEINNHNEPNSNYNNNNNNNNNKKNQVAHNLDVREDIFGNISVPGLREMSVSTLRRLEFLIKRGNSRRTMAATERNAVSSRSHAVLQITVEGRERINSKLDNNGQKGEKKQVFSDQLKEELNENNNKQQEEDDDNEDQLKDGKKWKIFLNSKLSLIDLAGSERAQGSGNVGARMREGANINKSLLALGSCINALSAEAREEELKMKKQQKNAGIQNQDDQNNEKDNEQEQPADNSHPSVPNKEKHIPYRDSKLTRLLKDSLGGNTRTVMIANVSPSAVAYEETLSTLTYAARAKAITRTIVKTGAGMSVGQFGSQNYFFNALAQAHKKIKIFGEQKERDKETISNLKDQLRKMKNELLNAQEQVVSLQQMNKSRHSSVGSASNSQPSSRVVSPMNNKSPIIILQPQNKQNEIAKSPLKSQRTIQQLQNQQQQQIQSKQSQSFIVAPQCQCEKGSCEDISLNCCTDEQNKQNLYINQQDQNSIINKATNDFISDIDIYNQQYYQSDDEQIKLLQQVIQQEKDREVIEQAIGSIMGIRIKSKIEMEMDQNENQLQIQQQQQQQLGKDMINEYQKEKLQISTCSREISDRIQQMIEFASNESSNDEITNQNDDNNKQSKEKKKMIQSIIEDALLNECKKIQEVIDKQIQKEKFRTMKFEKKNKKMKQKGKENELNNMKNQQENQFAIVKSNPNNNSNLNLDQNQLLNPSDFSSIQFVLLKCVSQYDEEIQRSLVREEQIKEQYNRLEKDIKMKIEKENEKQKENQKEKEIQKEKDNKSQKNDNKTTSLQQQQSSNIQIQTQYQKLFTLRCVLEQSILVRHNLELHRLSMLQQTERGMLGAVIVSLSKEVARMYSPSAQNTPFNHNNNNNILINVSEMVRNVDQTQVQQQQQQSNQLQSKQQQPVSLQQQQKLIPPLRKSTSFDQNQQQKQQQQLIFDPNNINRKSINNLNNDDLNNKLNELNNEINQFNNNLNIINSNNNTHRSSGSNRMAPSPLHLNANLFLNQNPIQVQDCKLNIQDNLSQNDKLKGNYSNNSNINSNLNQNDKNNKRSNQFNTGFKQPLQIPPFSADDANAQNKSSKQNPHNLQIKISSNQQLSESDTNILSLSADSKPISSSSSSYQTSSSSFPSVTAGAEQSNLQKLFNINLANQQMHPIPALNTPISPGSISPQFRSQSHLSQLEVQQQQQSSYLNQQQQSNIKSPSSSSQQSNIKSPQISPSFAPSSNNPLLFSNKQQNQQNQLNLLQQNQQLYQNQQLNHRPPPASSPPQFQSQQQQQFLSQLQQQQQSLSKAQYSSQSASQLNRNPFQNISNINNITSNDNNNNQQPILNKIRSNPLLPPLDKQQNNSSSSRSTNNSPQNMNNIPFHQQESQIEINNNILKAKPESILNDDKMELMSVISQYSQKDETKSANSTKQSSNQPTKQQIGRKSKFQPKQPISEAPKQQNTPEKRISSLQQLQQQQQQSSAVASLLNQGFNNNQKEMNKQNSHQAKPAPSPTEKQKFHSQSPQFSNLSHLNQQQNNQLNENQIKLNQQQQNLLNQQQQQQQNKRSLSSSPSPVQNPTNQQQQHQSAQKKDNNINNNNNNYINLQNILPSNARIRKPIPKQRSTSAHKPAEIPQFSKQHQEKERKQQELLQQQKQQQKWLDQFGGMQQQGKPKTKQTSNKFDVQIPQQSSFTDQPQTLTHSQSQSNVPIVQVEFQDLNLNQIINNIYKSSETKQTEDQQPQQQKQANWVKNQNEYVFQNKPFMPNLSTIDESPPISQGQVNSLLANRQKR